MMLTTKQSYELLAKHGCYVKEICDECNKLLGAIRFTRLGQTRVWCSRECRDGTQAHAPGTCWSCGVSLAGLRRGTRFCSAVCRVRESRKSQTRKISRNEQLKIHDLQGQVEDLAIPAHSAPPRADLAGWKGTP
jgi:hypothetical protein